MRRGTLPHWLFDRDLDELENLARRRADEENDLVWEWDQIEIALAGHDEGDDE
jgi:hypothetical protein